MDTDFVVMGSEPVVPPVSDPNNANEVLRQTEKKKQLEQYQVFHRVGRTAQASRL